VVRKLCRGCSHPGAWLSDGRQLLYTTLAGEVAKFDLESGQSRTVVSAGDGITLASPDWNPRNQHLLFTAITKKDGSRRVFTVPLPREADHALGAWVPLTSASENADLARWSDDGSHFYYFSNRDGFYCIWGGSSDHDRQVTETTFSVRHYHDWGRGPLLVLPYLEGISVAHGSFYATIGEATSTIWVGRLRYSPIRPLLQRIPFLRDLVALDMMRY
jgi:hypothetical protein